MPRLARADAYLSALPGGLSAHPECQAKGVLVRMLAADAIYAASAWALPEPLRRMIEDPPMGSEWISEVHLQALRYALADLAGQDDDELLAGIRPRDRRMYESPAYRVLMSTPSPAALLRGAALRWANWHRGSELEVEGIADDGVRLALRFPAGVFDGLQLRMIAETFLAALDLTGAVRPRADIREVTPGRARFLVAWDPP